MNGEVVEQPLHSREEACRLGSDQRHVVQEGRSVVRPFEAGRWTARYRLSCGARFRLGTDR